jgi:hypothetical protein
VINFEAPANRVIPVDFVHFVFAHRQVTVFAGSHGHELVRVGFVYALGFAVWMVFATKVIQIFSPHILFFY